MFFASGLGAYNASIFHLTTHGFFKALLFLCAGSVIHAMSNEQDMRKMGGLYKKIPITAILMWIGSLTIIGFPFFSGYYSKESILEVAFFSKSNVVLRTSLRCMFSIPDIRFLIRDMSEEIFYFFLKIRFFHNLAEIHGIHIAAISSEQLLSYFLSELYFSEVTYISISHFLWKISIFQNNHES